MHPLLLIIDDEEEILAFLERILRKQYSIITAINGRDAFNKLQEAPVQLIICDIMMPEMDGFEFSKKLKADFQYSHIPIILLTAMNTIQSKVQGLELGADAYIEKPFSKEHLFAQIASLLANRKMLREYFSTSPMAHIRSMAHSKADEHFLETLNRTITENIEYGEIDVEKLAKILYMSRVTLYRKIKAITNMSPQELINIIRLKKAAELLAEGSHRISEVASMVGFSSQSNFSRNFLRQFEMTPSDYLQQTELQRKNTNDQLPEI